MMKKTNKRTTLRLDREILRMLLTSDIKAVVVGGQRDPRLTGDSEKVCCA